MAGLFDTFEIGKRGLSTQQSLINTTAHNISNSATTGYSRQRAVATTTTPSGGNSKFDSCSVGQVGTGSQISSIERIRDTFLDTKVRDQTSGNSSLDIQNQYLQEVEDSLNETSNTGVTKALSNFYSALQALSTDPVTNKTTTIGTASTLAGALNDKYNSLENKESDAQAQLGNDVSNVNDILDNITSLNKQIKDLTASGMSPNDLMDTRDNLLDTLSTKLGVTVKSEKDNGIDISSTEDSNNVGNLVTAADTTGATCTRFSYVDSVDYNSTTGMMTVKYDILGDKNNTTTTAPIAVASADADALKASLLKNRILIAGKDGTVNATDEATLKSSMLAITQGEIGGNQASQDVIQDNMNKLDTIAKTLAYTVNAIQTGSDTDGTTLTGLDSDLVFVADGTTSDDGINAKNLRVNTALANDPTKLNTGATANSGEKDGTRALAMANIKDLKIDFTTIGNGTTLTTRKSFLDKSGVTFTDTGKSALQSSATGTTLGSKYQSNIDQLATTIKSVNTLLSTSENSLANFENERQSVSGVSLDEESTNLIQYQHAYQANAKVISTIDSLLDIVINGLMK